MDRSKRTTLSGTKSVLYGVIWISYRIFLGFIVALLIRGAFT